MDNYNELGQSSVCRMIISPKYKLYKGELSDKHPINLYHDESFIVINEYQANGVIKEIGRIDYTKITTDISATMPPVLIDICARPSVTFNIMTDICYYIKSSEAFDEFCYYIRSSEVPDEYLTFLKTKIKSDTNEITTSTSCENRGIRDEFEQYLIDSDFGKLPANSSNRCFDCGYTGNGRVFYITEWEFSTGASTDGIVYCESCVLSHITK